VVKFPKQIVRGEENIFENRAQASILHKIDAPMAVELVELMFLC